MPHRLRVAHIVCSDAFAGAERYVTTLAASQAAHDHDVVVIGGEEGRMRLALAPSNVIWVPGDSLTSAALAVIRARPLDVVHAHMTAGEVAAAATSFAVSAPIVATRHFAQRRGSSLGGRAVRGWLAGTLSAQLAISRFVAERVGEPSTIVFPSVVDGEKRIDASMREPTVVVAQRLEAEKHTDLAIDAWGRSGLSRRGWRLAVAGEGSERRKLEDLAARFGVGESCTFLGSVVDVRELFRRASILLAPRPDEPFGLSVVEAMAEGLPVVAAAGGGHLETIGLARKPALFSPGDASHASAVLVDLASNPDRRNRYGEELRQLQRRHFSPDRQVAATLEVYRAVCGNAGTVAA